MLWTIGHDKVSLRTSEGYKNSQKFGSFSIKTDQSIISQIQTLLNIPYVNLAKH